MLNNYFSKSVKCIGFTSSYNPLPENEDISDRGEYHVVPQRHRQSFWRRGLPALLILCILFGSILVILTFNGTVIYFSNKPTSFTPILRSTTVTFEENHLFMMPSSSESDDAWNSLMPSGRGFVLVDNPETYGLKPGIPTAGMIRESYYSALQGKRPNIFGEDGLSGEKEKHIHQEHTGHCFDYLRQAIMCAGDMTLEWAMEAPPGKAPFTVDGWGVSHNCRDWDQAVDWTYAHRAPHNHSGIA